MKKVIILLVAVMLPLLSFAQTYDIETAKKFYKAKYILKNAKGPFEDAGWWYTGTAAGSDAKFFTPERYYDTEKIKRQFQVEDLYTFLQDKNNRIALSALADYVTDHNKRYNFHNDYEALLSIGIDPIEAAIRMNRNIDLEEEDPKIYYTHCHVEVMLTAFGGRSSAISKVENIKVNTTEQEIEEIRTQIENEKPLVEQFNQDMKKLKKQIRRENRKGAIKKFGDKILNGLENVGNKFQKAGEGINYQHG